MYNNGNILKGGFIMEDLVRKAKEGDKFAMEELLNRFKFFIYKQAGKFSIPSYDFDDLVQHGYLSVINAVKLYNPEKNSFTTYCTNGIINNFNALLKGKIKHFREVQDEGILNSKVCEFTLEDEIIAYEETLNLKKAMVKLNYQEQNILNLVYVKGLTLKEAAALCDVKYRVAIEIRKIALGKLKQFLKNKCI